MNKINLKRLSYKELSDFVAQMDGRPYRAKQMAAWIFLRGVCQFGQMTDIPLQFREKLDTMAYIGCVSEKSRQVSTDGTVKFLFALQDGLTVESVLISEGARRTLCVSTQVGCKLACAFCLTGASGFTRDLDAAEIVDQVIRARELSDEKKITNLVLMGMGEPLDNFDKVIHALKLVTDPEYQLVGVRKITVSTVGLAPGIERLGRELPKVKLAVSLNAGDDATRERIMPITKKYPMDALAKALAVYPLPQGRRITLEYVLLKGVNDEKKDAEGLSRFAKKFPSKINLIPFNQTAGIPFARPDIEDVRRFKGWLVEKNHTVMIRDSKGADILAACGQLAGDKWSGGKT
ncbi:MAG: 23S rRNA (adenine(2503)-C(2))-methyltransferase RlmN [Nitrospinota bacterium]|nr:23S rRNA (adenine(2503)-C(2))-methyltransferase RlmN [Nitrospinota bacterium]